MDFIELLRRLDQKQYPAYRDVETAKGWIDDMEGYSLYIGRAQSDPYAKPTQCRIVVANETAKFPSVSYQNKVRSVALGDYLNRVFLMLEVEGAELRKEATLMSVEYDFH